MNKQGAINNTGFKQGDVCTYNKKTGPYIQNGTTVELTSNPHYDEDLDEWWVSGKYKTDLGYSGEVGFCTKELILSGSK